MHPSAVDLRLVHCSSCRAHARRAEEPRVGDRRLVDPRMHPCIRPVSHSSIQPNIHPSSQPSRHPVLSMFHYVAPSTHCASNSRIHRCALLRGGSQTYCKLECVNHKSSGCQFKVILRSSRSHQHWKVDLADSDWTHVSSCQCKSTFTAKKALDIAVVRQKILEHGRHSSVSYVHLSIHPFMPSIHNAHYPCVHASTHPASAHPACIYPSIHLCRLSTMRTIHAPVHPSTHPSTPSIHISIRTSIYDTHPCGCRATDTPGFKICSTKVNSSSIQIRPSRRTSRRSVDVW
jgi:hypothetical protein